MGSAPNFNNAIQLEEITHFRRDNPTRSILSTHKKFRKKIPKKVSYSNLESSPVAGSSNSMQNGNHVDEFAAHVDEFKSNVEEFSEESSSDFGGSDDDAGDGYQGFHKDTANSSTVNGGLGSGSGGSAFTLSDENLFPIPSIQVTKADLFFTVITFLTNFGELVTDFVLVVWHYQNGQKWASGLTMTFMTAGGIGLLYQFGLLQQAHLDRLFRRGKRVRILVSSIPPAATTIVSYQSTMTGWKAMKEPMLSQQYFKIIEFLQSLSRIQSFFQAAPQATLQLIILLENVHETSWEKVVFTLVNILISLTVMTNANLPLKTDTTEDGSSPIKAAYIPMSRIFMGFRMFSSLGSRTMALAYLLVGCRCLLQPDSTLFGSTMIAIILAIFPRLVFTLTDYLTGQMVTRRNLERYQSEPEVGISFSQPIQKLPFCQIFIGYLATIFFPVGDPLWLFWYLWCESGIFIMFGNVAGTVTNDCVDGSVDGIYTGVFIVVFIIVPIIIPYIRAVVQRYKIQKFTKVLQVVEDRDDLETGSSGGNYNASRGVPTPVGMVEALGINDNPNYDPGYGLKISDPGTDMNINDVNSFSGRTSNGKNPFTIDDQETVVA